MTKYGILVEKAEWLNLNILEDFKSKVHNIKGRKFHEFIGQSINIIATEVKSSPLTAIIIEFMKNIFETHAIFRMATCGSLRNDFKEGSIFVIDSGVRGEGTSKCYVDVEYPAVADFRLTYLLHKNLAKKHIPHLVGTTWTTDGRFTETEDLLASWQRKGIIAVDMESSAFFVTSKIRDIKAANMCVVTDCPLLSKSFKEKYLFSENDEWLLPSIEICLKTILEVIEQMEKTT